MLCLEVTVNNQRYCLAGVGEEGAISAFVTWARFRPDDARQELPVPPGSTTLTVSGIMKDLTAVHWGQIADRLSVGDTVTIRVVDASEPESYTPTQMLPEEEDCGET